MKRKSILEKKILFILKKLKKPRIFRVYRDFRQKKVKKPRIYRVYRDLKKKTENRKFTEILQKIKPRSR